MTDYQVCWELFISDECKMMYWMCRTADKLAHIVGCHVTVFGHAFNRTVQKSTRFCLPVSCVCKVLPSVTPSDTDSCVIVSNKHAHYAVEINS